MPIPLSLRRRQRDIGVRREFLCKLTALPTRVARCDGRPVRVLRGVELLHARGQHRPLLSHPRRGPRQGRRTKGGNGDAPHWGYYDLTKGEPNAHPQMPSSVFFSR